MVTAAPYVPPHTHTYGPCQKDAWGGTYSRRCTYPSCRAFLHC